ncbi:MAG: hypothetical protein LBI54_00680 [Lachnospiraceae bacterium]|jgi:hypothetical protein|nr:hypothetical protein [Lachnospiraceae bacterium]
MRYVSKIHALNLPCSLATCGDWHQSALQWDNPNMCDTDESVFGGYGIESGKFLPEHGNEPFFVANHIRALLDLLEAGNFSTAQGMNADFICNGSYDTEIFEKTMLLKDLPHWKDIDLFMGREYHVKWLDFKENLQEAALK